MDGIPLIILLTPYGLILLVATIFLIFNVFHLLRYGVEGKGTALLTATYIFLFMFTIGFTSSALLAFDWSQIFTLDDLLPNSAGLPDYGL